MNTKILIAAIASILLMSSCSTYPKGLTTASNLKTDVTGSVIKIKPKSQHYIYGELIAVEGDSIYVLTRDKQMMILDNSNVFKYYVYMGTPDKSYGWTYVLFPVLSISQGFLMILTVPLNFIAASMVNGGNRASLIYTRDDLPIEQLHTAARFPQGIPAGILIDEIKPILSITVRGKSK